MMPAKRKLEAMSQKNDDHLEKIIDLTVSYYCFYV